MLWGEVLSLLTAVAWAVAVILFRRSGEHVHPLGLSMFKNLLGAACCLVTMPLFGETLRHAAPRRDYGLLLLSGGLGIGVGDTLFFFALNALGAGRAAIVDCLYSPFVIGLSMLWLGERLTTAQAAGAVMILSAVLAVTREGRSTRAERGAVFRGVLWGALAMASMAVGIVMAKPILDRSPLLWVTEVRLFGGIACLAVVLAAHPGRRAILATVRAPQRWRYTLSGSFIGTYLAMVTWLGGMKLAPASIAAALNQTSNIFIFILAAVFLRERITRVRALGIALGVAGSFVVMFG